MAIYINVYFIISTIIAIADTNKFAEERKNRDSDLINVNALQGNVKMIYEKVNTRHQCITKDEIKKFSNALTSDPGEGTVYEHNFVQFPMDTKTFTIFKDRTTFKMLKYFDTSLKIENFEKLMIEVKKLDGQAFLNM